MRWYDDYLEACKEGSNSFLFVGHVADGFPRGIDAFDPSEPHPDLLDPWAEAVFRRADPSALVWIYDVVRGFRFRTPKDEQFFRKCVIGDAQVQARSAKGTGDAIAAAQATMLATMPLPVADAGAALEAMRWAFRACSEKDKVRPCIAVLPDVDAFLTAAAGSPDRQAARISLAAIQFAADDGFRRAGHRLLMSAASAQALDERLTRPESPVRLIRVIKPDERERERFLEGVIEYADGLKARREAISAKRAAAEKRERAELRARLAEALKDLEAYRQDEARQIRRALAARPKSDRNRHSLLLKDRARYEKLIAHPEEQILNARTWSALRTGDLVVFVKKRGREVRRVRHDRGSIILLKRQGGGFRPETTSATVERERYDSYSGAYHTMNERQTVPWAYSMSDGKLMRKPQGTHERPIDAPVPKDLVRPLRIPRESAEAEALLQETDRKIAKLLRGCGKEMQLGLAERKEKVAKLKAALKGPISGVEVKCLEAERTATDELLKNPPTPPPLPKSGIAEFTRMTRGFGYRDLARTLDLMRLRKRPLTDAELAAHRQDLLRKAYGDLFDIVDPAYGFDGVAGLDHVKAFFGDVKRAIVAGDHKAVPMGCLLLGPPGTGKTAVAEAFARECGFLFVKMKSLRTMWVGESERKQEAALQGLRDLSPAIVLRDEVDEEDAGRDSYQGDSGVSGRLRRMWMEFLSDPKIRGRVFVISCSNRPDRLDAALKRSGRTDERIPLLMPDAPTREAIFEVMVRRHGFPSALKRYGTYARLTDGLSGADIEVIVRRAYEFAAAAGKKAIDDDALRAAVEDFIPSASKVDIARMTLAAVRETSSKRYLPRDVKTIVRAAEAELEAAEA